MSEEITSPEVMQIGSHYGLSVHSEKLTELGVTLEELSSLPRELLVQLRGVIGAAKKQSAPKNRTKRRGEYAMWTVPRIGGAVDRGEVRVLARADGYAMVRRKGGMPFVCRECELTKPG